MRYFALAIGVAILLGSGFVGLMLWNRPPAGVDDEPEPLLLNVPRSRSVVLSVCYLGRGEQLLAAGSLPALPPDNKWIDRAEGWVGVFDAAGGELVRELPPTTRTVRGVTVNPRTKEVVTYGVWEKKSRGAPYTHGEVLVWDSKAEKQLRKFPGHSFDVYGLAFDPEGRRVVTGSVGPANVQGLSPSKTEGVTTWDFEAAAMLHTVEGHAVLKVVGPPGSLPAFPGTRAVLDVAWSADGKRVFSAGEDGAVKAWDADTLKPLATVCQRGAWAERLALTPAGDKLLVLYSDGVLLVFDARSYKELRTATVPPHPRKHTPTPRHTGGISVLGSYFKGAGLAASPDGKSCAVATGFAAATVPLDGPGEPAAIPTTLVGPNCVAYSPDGRYLAIGFSDAILGEKAQSVGGVEQWDLKANAPRKLTPARP